MSAFLSAFKSASVSNVFLPNATALAQSVALTQAFLSNFIVAGTSPANSVLAAQSPQNGQPAQYWNEAIALSALAQQVRALLANGNSEPALQLQLVTLIDSVLSAQKSQWPSGFLRDYFDDQLWMVAALLDAYELTAEPTHLSDAQALFQESVASGFDNATGVMWWDRKHTQKATAANGGAMVAAIRLAALSEQRAELGLPPVNLPKSQAAHTQSESERRSDGDSLLSFASALYSRWMNLTLPSGEAIDHLDPAGNRIYYGNGFTYNQALLIHSALGLAAAAAASDPQQAAELYAQADRLMQWSVSNQTTASGVFVDCADDTGCTSGDCGEFKGIHFAVLSAYVERSGQRAMAAAAQGASAAVVEPLLSNLCAAQWALWDSAASAFSRARSAGDLLSCQWANEWIDGSAVLQGAQNAGVLAFASAAQQVGLWITGANTANKQTKHAVQQIALE